jgi:hypothetical protein
MISTIRKRFLLSAGICAVLLALGYLALVKTTWGQTLDNKGYFGRNVVARAVLEYDHHILGAVNISALIVATIALLVLGAARRCLHRGPGRRASHRRNRQSRARTVCRLDLGERPT